MSLVGTRPPTVDEWELYEPHHRATVPVNHHSENYILTKLRICYLLHIIKYHIV